MVAQIRHVAITSHNYLMLGKFYEAVFGMKSSGKTSPFGYVACSDGYVGLNLNPRRDGYIGGIDHFGMVVDDVDTVFDRMRQKHPGANIVLRPSTRPFAAYSGNDPDGNVFDLAQKKNDRRQDVYAEQAEEDWNGNRYLSKFAIRTPNVDRVAEFYMDVFDLKPLNGDTEAPGHHLTDGRVTLSIMPWSIELFEGMAVKRPGPDHIGFKVESLDAFKADVETASELNTFLRPTPVGGRKEAGTRQQLLARCSFGKLQMADPDSNWIDVTDE